ncbi:SAM-dependent methyltransferase [Sphingomonas sp.]|uniref:class I SAM-dependent methyltransferase n=1 Tax=Sphingomonas sp. TaxID=28214 RepID=UPI0025D14025|nr:SAM-dependent methyltransferase [Sphingomonas sp.]
MSVAQFMAAANAEYYATRASVGADGDFITAPEISQMFGELIGVWLTDLWDRAGRPAVHYVELGPGRGTLAVDAGRAMARGGMKLVEHLVETSPRLRDEQRRVLPGAIWHDDITTLPKDGALVVVCNEFFDALPVQQLVRAPDGWRQRMVACQDTLFLPVSGKLVPETIVPESLRDAPVGSIVETSPPGVAIIRALSQRLERQGGAVLVVDYGYDGPAAGETLQAVRHHQPANPFDAPGTVDLSAHVDFATLGAAATLTGSIVHGPVSQRDFLGSMGIAARAAALARQSPARADEIVAAHQRLTAPDAMGILFRAMAITARNWPIPSGFS